MFKHKKQKLNKMLDFIVTTSLKSYFILPPTPPNNHKRVLNEG